MRQRMSDHEIQQALALLCIDPSDLEKARSAPTLDEAQRLLDDLKSRVRKAYKQKAFETHPDRTGNDPGKTAQFKLLTQFTKAIEGLRLVVRRPQPVLVPLWSPWMYNSVSTASTTSTAPPGFGSFSMFVNGVRIF